MEYSNNFISVDLKLQKILDDFHTIFFISSPVCNGEIGFTQTQMSQENLFKKSRTTSSDFIFDLPSFFGLK